MGDMARLTTRTTPDPDVLQAELDDTWQRAHTLAVKLLTALTGIAEGPVTSSG